MIISQIKDTIIESGSHAVMGRVLTLFCPAECWEEGCVPAGGCIYLYRRAHCPGFGLHWGFDFPFAYLDHPPGYHGYHNQIGFGSFPLDPGWNDLNHPRCWSSSQNNGCSWRACYRYTSSKV